MKPIFRREIVTTHGLRYDEDLRLGEDLLFYADLLLAGARFGVTHQCLYRYSVRTGSISAEPKPTEQMIEVNRRIRNRLQTTKAVLPDRVDLITMLQAREYALWYQLFTWCFRCGLFTKALYSFKQMPFLFVLQQSGERILRRFRQL